MMTTNTAQIFSQARTAFRAANAEASKVHASARTRIDAELGTLSNDATDEAADRYFDAEDDIEAECGVCAAGVRRYNALNAMVRAGRDYMRTQDCWDAEADIVFASYLRENGRAVLNHKASRRLETLLLDLAV